VEIVVCIKQVLDPYGMVYYDHQKNEVSKDGVPSVINPLDELALEYALKLKDSMGARVTVISLGSDDVEGSLRYCLSTGADNAILITVPEAEALEAQATGRVLAKAISSLQYDLVLCGLRASDDNASLVWAVIADQLGLSAVCGVRNIAPVDSAHLTVYRGEEGGERRGLKLALPAVLAVEMGEQLRYPALRLRLAAQKATIERRTLNSLGISAEELSAWSGVRLAKFSAPKPRRRGLLIPDESLSGFERMQLLMTGGIATKGSSRLKGEPGEVAVELAQVLRANDLSKTS